MSNVEYKVGDLLIYDYFISHSNKTYSQIHYIFEINYKIERLLVSCFRYENNQFKSFETNGPYISFKDARTYTHIPQRKI